jgi:serine/threonine-protein kinase
MPEVDPNKPLRVVGRYALYGKLATGGMATVHFGRLLGPVGFSRTVAIKRLHPQFAKDPEFYTMFMDEARLAARIQHPNVVATLDVVATGDELFLVMDYIRGESFSRLLRTARKKGQTVPEGFLGSVISGMLHGLHAAHEATDERGEPLRVVHRDVSPQNVLVGVDGVARVLDFGVAKAAARVQVTREGQMKGKLSYMSPEQLQGRGVDRRTDIFAAGVVLWESLTGQRLFTGDDATEILTRIITSPVTPPSQINPYVRPELDAVTLRALEKDPDHRFATSREFAIAIEETMHLMSPREVGEWVEEIAGDSLEQREEALAEIESLSAVGHLSAFNDSDPQMLRTLVETFTGRHSVPTVPDNFPPFLRNDAATQVYGAAHSIEPMPVDEPTLIFQNTEELTQPGRRPSGAPDGSPFTTPDEKRRRLILAAAAGLLFLFGGVALAGLFGGGAKSSETEQAAALPTIESAPSPKVAAAPSRPPVPVASPEELPPAEEPVTRPKPKPRAREVSGGTRPAANKSRPGSKKPSAPSAKAAKCAKPWFIDAQGIRRIKPDCL